MKELIKRAILGSDIKELAANITEIGFSPVICNRIIAGCVKEEDIDMNKIHACINNKAAIDVVISITNNTKEESLVVTYNTIDTRFVKSGTVVEDKIYSEKEMWNLDTTYAKDEEYVVPIKYYCKHERTLIPENFVK